MVAVRKIATPDGDILGYLKVREAPGEDRKKGDPKPIVKRPFRINWVHDRNFKTRGFYTDEGRTYVLDRDGEFIDEGLHHIDDAKLIILGKNERQPIVLLEMDMPRTLEGDREKAAADKIARDAAAKAAAGKEGAAEGGKVETEKKPE